MRGPWDVAIVSMESPGSTDVSRQQTSTGANREPGRNAVTAPKTGGIRLRAIVIGLLMSAVIVGMTQALSIERDAAEVGGGAPAPTPTYLLFFYVLLSVPLAAAGLEFINDLDKRKRKELAAQK